jgi:TonB-dependent SusC/RagA subfamily outer membrane receptor
MKLKILLLALFSCFLLTSSFTQEKANKKRMLSGQVTDAKGTPVSGANIFIDNNNVNVVTDDNGSFKVKIKPDAKKITAFTLNSGAGMALIEGKSVINIVLDGKYSDDVQKVNPAEEETVNIGYEEVNKKDLTTTVNKIDASERQFAGYNNIYDMIRGRCPGVTVNGKSITIRGTSTLMGSTEPLFVLNGIVVSTIDNIIPQEVKSIEVLKGSSAAIYGSRGANGVILITLKK